MKMIFKMGAMFGGGMLVLGVLCLVVLNFAMAQASLLTGPVTAKDLEDARAILSRPLPVLENGSVWTNATPVGNCD